MFIRVAVVGLCFYSGASLPALYYESGFVVIKEFD